MGNSSIKIHMASLYFNLNNTNSYEFTMSKLSAITYLIALTIILVFLLLSFVIVVVWVKRKNETLLGICKMLVIHKQLKNNIHDDATSIFNPLKKYQKSKVIIEPQENQNQQNSQSISSPTDQQETTSQKTLDLDPILLEEIKNLTENGVGNNLLKTVPGVDSLSIMREWMNKLSMFQPFFIVAFLLVCSQRSSFIQIDSGQYQSQSNDTFILIGMILLFISLLLYLLINCSRIIFKLIAHFSNQVQISPLKEENSSFNNLIKKPEQTEIKKDIASKSFRFITSKGIQTQVQIHEITVQKVIQPQARQENCISKTQSQPLTINEFNQQIHNSSYFFDVVYLIPLGISIVLALINVF